MEPCEVRISPLRWDLIILMLMSLLSCYVTKFLPVHVDDSLC